MNRFLIPNLKREPFAAMALAALIAVSAGAAVSAQSLEAIDTSGRRLVLQKRPTRIISLSPSATEILFFVGAGERVIGVTTYCDWPPEAARIQKVGGFSSETISLETIVSLRPDLVVSGGVIHASLLRDFDRLKIMYFDCDPLSLEGIFDSMIQIGKITGEALAAQSRVADLRARLAPVQAFLRDIPQVKRPTVFWEVYEDPLMTCGAPSYIDDAISAAGGLNVFSDQRNQWPTVSAEELITRAPAYILGADDHGESFTPKAVTARPGWRGIPAVRSGRIFLLPANLVSRPGPRLVDGILAIAEILYPGMAD